MNEQVLRTNVPELQNWFLWLSPQLSLIFSLLEITSPYQSWQKRSRVNASAAAGKVWCGSWDSLSLPMQTGLAKALMSSFPACSAARGVTSAKGETHSWRNNHRNHQSSSVETFLSPMLKIIFGKKRIFFHFIFTLDIVLAYKAREITKLINKSWTTNKQNCF